MASTKARTAKVPTRPQAPHPRQAKPAIGKRWLLVGSVAVAVAVIAIGLIVLSHRGSSGTAAAGGSGLPDTSDYHSLLVSAARPNELILGTHQGLFRSTDGGRRWASYALRGTDAMNLAQPGGAQTVWLAGHDVFARSSDGGANWQSLHPSSLASLDLHGFTVDPRHTSTLYAAVAGVGLFRSRDAGNSFSEVSKTVGGMVMALAVTPGGEILAGDMQRGLLASRDGGATWHQRLRAQLAGLAINPHDPKTILATGPGILRSTDGGQNWSPVARIAAGAGPVSWSPSNPRVAYVVGFDRTLYRSSNNGATWSAVK